MSTITKCDTGITTPISYGSWASGTTSEDLFRWFEWYYPFPTILTPSLPTYPTQVTYPTKPLD